MGALSDAVKKALLAALVTFGLSFPIVVFLTDVNLSNQLTLTPRWWLAAMFGLLHGFGFASVLRDYGLPRDSLLPALAAFNAGVELGQVAVVLVVMFAFAALRLGGPGREPNRRFMLGLSGTILVLGLYWTAQALRA